MTVIEYCLFYRQYMPIDKVEIKSDLEKAMFLQSEGFIFDLRSDYLYQGEEVQILHSYFNGDSYGVRWA